MKVATPFNRTYLRSISISRLEWQVDLSYQQVDQRKSNTCKGVSPPLSSDMLAINKPHSVLIPTAVTWVKS